MEPGDHELIEAVYAAFADYGREETFEGCGCGACSWDGVVISESGWNGTARPIVRADSPGGRRPLRELTEEDLSVVAIEMGLTGGTVSLYKHYLPRALEILADGGWKDWPDAESVVDAMEREPEIEGMQWRSWPEPERRAIAQFLARFDPRDPEAAP